ncbi:MAG: DNA repair protein RadA [Candidatus Moraniibacteriota bacterium]|jgi:DNA repair protein RadA/Sms|nr:MAG: DNA repair protein RadA [Candidatus Moranbacteria bacterium]
MASKKIFVCNNCGNESSKWLGLCPMCQNWNTFQEMTIPDEKTATKTRAAESVKDLKTIGQIKSTALSRITTTIAEFDRVLGGGEKQGIVPGEVILLSGDPGIGKSTIMLQIAINIASSGKKVLYVSGEESESQIKMRAERIADEKALIKYDLYVLSSTDIDQAVATATDKKVDLLIIDSIQTVASNDANGFPGSLPQLRYSTLKLVNFAKRTHIPVFFIGHVTKEGTIAGPQMLAHMVDCVLYLEGESLTGTRILRSLKNRFGDTSEVGIFIMEEKGLSEITNVKDFFLGTQDQMVPGSCVTVVMEGSRPLLVEIQALAVNTNLPFPRRVAQGVPEKRVELLLAVLKRHGTINVDKYDIFVNVVGGLKIAETASDLAICLAIASSIKGNTLKSVVGISEVGLLGETKVVLNLDKRIKEAKKFGYKNIITVQNATSLKKALIQGNLS